MSDRTFLIWSIEHDAWWAPGHRGYTRELYEAGRYDEAEAEAIVARANLVAFHECLVPAACVAEASGGNLWEADREALRAIEAGGPELLERIVRYYRDPDRAVRTPRAFLYLHLGMVIGEAIRPPRRASRENLELLARIERLSPEAREAIIGMIGITEPNPTD